MKLTVPHFALVPRWLVIGLRDFNTFISLKTSITLTNHYWLCYRTLPPTRHRYRTSAAPGVPTNKPTPKGVAGVISRLRLKSLGG